MSIDVSSESTPIQALAERLGTECATLASVLSFIATRFENEDLARRAVGEVYDLLVRLADEAAAPTTDPHGLPAES